MVDERLLALNDELAGAQRRIARQAAELERQNDRLRELDQLKDALLANVSHDLRTPLTAILGYAELMARRGGLTEQQARSAAVIERNARRLLRMVNDLLLLAQARAGRLEIAHEPVDLAELVNDASELARPLAAQAQLHLGCVTPPAGALTVTGDRLRLDQLLDNLLANALKFTPPGGHVTVRAFSGATGPALEVQDDGPGIAPADQARLYDAFVRGATAGAPGTGLGLTIVREIATAHGASVTVDCSGGVTRFVVTFPEQS
jgi:signal transduction histidine kinase